MTRKISSLLILTLLLVAVGSLNASNSTDLKFEKVKAYGFSFLDSESQFQSYGKGNAAISLAACELLKRGGLSITAENCRQGLLNLRWPGRLEIVSESPRIILDGAHNLIAARRLADFLAHETDQCPITMVIGILDDKPYKAMLSALVPVADKVIFTRPVIDRGLPPETLYAEARQYGKEITIFACGPRPMAAATASLAKKHKLSAQISLDAYMVCGIGACLGCAIKTKEGYKLACKDGPVFDAEEIEWRSVC